MRSRARALSLFFILGVITMNLTYLIITGTVGGTKVDLNIGIPIEDLFKNAPKVIGLLNEYMPAILKKIKETDSGN